LLPIVYVAGLYLSSFRSGTITRTGITGLVGISIDGTTWVDYPNPIESSIADPLYARFRTTGSGYSGVVTITWKLIDVSSGAEVHTLTDYTTYTLTGNAGDVIYATADGSVSGNFDWGSYASIDGDYYIEIDFNK